MVVIVVVVNERERERKRKRTGALFFFLKATNFVVYLKRREKEENRPRKRRIEPVG